MSKVEKMIEEIHEKLSELDDDCEWFEDIFGNWGKEECAEALKLFVKKSGSSPFYYLAYLFTQAIQEGKIKITMTDYDTWEKNENGLDWTKIKEYETTISEAANNEIRLTCENHSNFIQIKIDCEPKDMRHEKHRRN